MEKNDISQNSNINKFDKDIMQTQSYKIINENIINNNNNSAYINKNEPNKEKLNDNFNNVDYDDNLNMNININNYLSKQNISKNNKTNINYSSSINNNQNFKKSKNLLKKNKTTNKKDYLTPNLYNNINLNNKLRDINNLNKKKVSDNIMKSKLLERIRKQKDGLKKYNYNGYNINNNKYKISNKKKEGIILSKKEEKDENGKKNENEETKHIPKILTFLRTFKSFALPIKSNNDKKQNQNNNNNIKENVNNYMVNPNNSCLNISTKIKPNISKLNFNQRNIDIINNNKFRTDKYENEIKDGNEGEDFIDYNRFTFRNNIEEDEILTYKTFNKINNEDNILYNSIDINNNKIDNYNNNKKDIFDKDIKQNNVIDEYSKRNNYYYPKEYKNEKYNNKSLNNNRSEDFIKSYKNLNMEISPSFKQKNNINKKLFQKTLTSKDYIKPYFRKKYLKNKYNSPKPLPKNKTKNYTINTYNNISKQNPNINIQSIDINNYGNEDSFQSLNISKKYRKPVLNASFQRNNNFQKMGKTKSYYNDISADQINLSKNYKTIERSTKNDKIHEIVINMNDSIDSFNNESKYNINNNLNSNRSPLRKAYNTSASSYYPKRSPLSIKQNGGAYDNSEKYDTSQMADEEENNKLNKRNTIYSRFMEPFQRNENKKWYNEDSYFSYDIANMNKNNISKNKNFLYQKPIKAQNSSKYVNKNNSMYIKRVVHFDNKKNSIFNNSDFIYDSDFNNYKNRLDYTDYDEKDNNVFDFDAPKAIKDLMEDFSNNNNESVNDSSRENQFSVNSDINTNKLNVSSNNNNNNAQNNGDNSNVYIKKNNQNFSNRSNKKNVYMKKLNTVYNFYQGTKNFISKINDKVFRVHKKEEESNKNNIKKQNDNKAEKNINNYNNKNTNNKNTNLMENDLLNHQREITPRIKVNNENNNNNILYFTKNSISTPRPEEDNIKKNKKEGTINKKLINNKKYFYKKYYNFYIPKFNKNNYGIFLSKIKTCQPYKIPNISKFYMTKENIKIYKNPLKNKCYFQKLYIIKKNKIINNNSTNEKEHQKYVSFFSIGGNFNENQNDSNIYLNEKIKEDKNKNIINLKEKLFTSEKQSDLLLSSDFTKIENIDNLNKDSFSFKNIKNIFNSNNLSYSLYENENIEINNFNFTLPPKNIQNKFETKKIIPEKNNTLAIINNKGNINKEYKYDYNYILSLKNNKFSNGKNFLPQTVIEHIDKLKKITDFSLPLKKKNDIEENKNKKKLKKEEIKELIQNYFTPKKNELKKIINKNFLSENKIEEKNIPNIKLNLEWARNDFSKEIEQAENYIKELKKKMEQNSIKNDIICLLNKLTVDNINTILNKIINLIIKENEDNQKMLSDKDIIDNEYILIKVIVDKAITEKRFVNLYARLCFELYNKLIDKTYNEINFKNILMEECKIKFIEINNINNNNDENINNININVDDEKYDLIKKRFLGNIDFICELINVNILQQDIGFYYLEELFKKYKNINDSSEIEIFKKNLCLEAIVNFLSKFGKKIYENKNMNSFKNLNYFIDNNLSDILEKEKLPGFLKYKIINLIEKQKNKWKDSLYEKSILAKGKKTNHKNNNSISVNKLHRIRKRRHSNKNIKSISPNKSFNNKSLIENKGYNTYKDNKNMDIEKFTSPSVKININTNNNNEEIIKLIEKDLEKYEIFLKDNNITNKSELKKNSQIGNNYDWSTIEDVLSKNNIDLGEVIRCYIEVCIDQISNNSKTFISNDYIKNIIYYYSTNLDNKEKDIIHNKMINLFRNIQDICIDNFNMKEIMGYLLFILIDNKLNFIKDLNNFIGMDKEIIITIAEVIKYAILSSESKCKKYHNDFKQTKLFVDNSIFNDYVTNKIQESLNQF